MVVSGGNSVFPSEAFVSGSRKAKRSWAGIIILSQSEKNAVILALLWGSVCIEALMPNYKIGFSVSTS